REDSRDVGQTGRGRHFERRFTLVDSRTQYRVRAGVEQQLNRQWIAHCDSHVQCCVIVDASLVWVRTERQEQSDDVVDVGSSSCPRDIAGTTQGGDERRESKVGRSIRIGSHLEQHTDERERAVIDRVNQTRTNRVGYAAVRHLCWVVDCGPQGLQVALVKGVVDLLESPGCSASLFFTRHRVSIRNRAAKGRENVSVARVYRSGVVCW